MVTILGLLAGMLVGGSNAIVGHVATASAATTPSCVNTLYSVDWFTGTVNQIALPNGSASGAAVSSVVGDLGVDEPFARYNALALTTDGTTLFAADQSSGTGDYIYRMDVATGTVTAYPNAQSGIVGSLIGGAIDPVNGLYYLLTFGTTPTLYAFDTTTNTWIGKVGSFPGTAAGMNGQNISDIAFDANGTMFFTANTTSNGHSLYRVSGPVPATAGSATLTPALVSADLLPNDNEIGSLAFGSTGDLYLGQIASPQIQELNPANGAVVSQSSGTPIPGNPSDFASCAQPSTLTVVKDVVNRTNSSDEFTLGIGGLDTPATATTTGTATGLQSAAAGPVVVSPGVAYPVSESGAGSTDLSTYSASYQCVDSDNNVLASGAATSFDYTAPPPVDGHGVAATCTFTNTPLPRSYTVKKTSSAATALPGDVVTYSVKVTNTGPVAYTAADPASFTDDLSAVLDDATYNGDASGGATVSGSTLSWSGALGVGQTITVTYSVTVKDPDTGNRTLTNTVTPTGPGGSCVSTADCTTTTTVPGPTYTVAKSASANTAQPGDVVTYSVAVKNTGQVAYTAADPASFTDDLSAVLDDATYNGDASNGATVSGTTLSWSGALAVGQTVTVTYSVTVKNPDTGDRTLTNAVVPTGPGGTCATPGGCTTTTTVPTTGYTVAKSASVTSAQPGATVTYTVAVTNTGQTAYTAAKPASFTDDLSAVLDDATYNGDATNGATVSGNTLSWSGALAVGATVTITYSVTVNDPDTGDHTLTNVVVPTGPGGSCATPAGCTTTTPVASFTVAKTASAASVLPGGTLTYSVAVKNTGEVAYTGANPASFTDDLSAVLDDATYNGDADHGATVTGHTLSWSGALAVGGTVTITYSVTVASPDTGDHLLTNAVVPTGPGGGCVSAAGCTTTTPVASYTVAKTASVNSAMPGDTVTYTVTAVNTGQVAYTQATPATFTDDLSAVLDDATYNGDATNGATVTGSTLSWSGALPVGGTVTVTYSVTVKNPDTGNHLLTNAVVPTGPGGGCATAGGCTTTTPVGSLHVVKSTTATQVLPGATVPYSVTVTNTGQVPYTAAHPASFTDDLSSVLDDATYNGDAASSSGQGVTYSAPVLSWSGALAVGATVTVTYSVTVSSPDTGDHQLENAVVTPPGAGGNCPAGSTDPDCVVNVPSGSFTVSKTASATTAKPGDTVTYTVTAHNSGNIAYTAQNPASFTDDLSAVLDDATYNGDATAGATVAGDTLSWSGPLPAGGTVTVTYSVTVHDPDTGDHVLTNAVVPTAPGGGCATEGGCTTTTPVSGYTVAKSVDTVVAQSGQKVTYTVSVTNIGQVAYTAAHPASFTDDLSKVLDDATYNGDATAGATVTGSTLSWSGPLAVGATVHVRYSVTVKTPDTGDHHLDNTVVPTGPGGSCATPGGCVTRTPVLGYSVHKTVSSHTAVPGQKLTYAVTVTNTGAADYTTAHPATFTDDLTDALRLATYNHDATHGAVYHAPVLSWTGPLAVGRSVTVTYSMTVTAGATGKITNVVVTPPASGSNCDPGSTDPDCRTHTTVTPPPSGPSVNTGGLLARMGTPTGLLLMIGLTWALLVAAAATGYRVYRRREAS